MTTYPKRVAQRAAADLGWKPADVGIFDLRGPDGRLGRLVPTGPSRRWAPAWLVHAADHNDDIEVIELVGGHELA